MILSFLYFLATNALAFAFTATDKWFAIRNKNRISEKTLLGLVAVGGTIGSALAMLFFRHKTAKKTYLLKFYAIVFIQILVVSGLFYFRNAAI